MEYKSYFFASLCVIGEKIKSINHISVLSFFPFAIIILRLRRKKPVEQNCEFFHFTFPFQFHDNRGRTNNFLLIAYYWHRSSPVPLRTVNGFVFSPFRISNISFDNNKQGLFQALLLLAYDTIRDNRGCFMDYNPIQYNISSIECN